MSSSTTPQAPPENPFTDHTAEHDSSDNPFDDTNEADINFNDHTLKFERFCHFFVQSGINTYQTPSTDSWLGTYPNQGYGREQGRTYHDVRLSNLAGSAIDPSVVDITFDVYKQRLGLCLHDLTVRIKYEVGNRSKPLVLFCVNVLHVGDQYLALIQELGKIFRDAVRRLIQEGDGDMGAVGDPERLRRGLMEQLEQPTKTHDLTIKVNNSAIALDHNQLGSLVIPRTSWSNPRKLEFVERSNGWPHKLF